MNERSQRVIITGASSGIGLDLAKRFVEAGAKVVLNGRDARKLDGVCRALGAPDRVVAVAGSIADPPTATRLATASREAFGGTDVLVNNAGIFGMKPFLESSVDELDGFLSTNLRGTFLVTQAVVPLMIEAGGGSIINVGTVLVEQANQRMPAAAAMASKGGVHALTVSLAAELAKHNIRVNTLAPGIIRTPLIGEHADALASFGLLGRVGEVSETSDAALFLARATFITGNVLNVDGGYAHVR